MEVGGYVDLCDENKNGFVKIILTLIEGRLLVWRYLSQFNMDLELEQTVFMPSFFFHQIDLCYVYAMWIR